MLILQQWEPVISPMFPSQIPFWIKLQGLPLHFWDEKMIYNIGQDLATLDTIIVFDTGEELSITLEYEDLGYHCSRCNRLLHLTRNCHTTQSETHIQLPPRREISQVEPSAIGPPEREDPFKTRVDRHGNPFGERIQILKHRGRMLQNKMTPAVVAPSRTHDARPPRHIHKRPTPTGDSKDWSSAERARPQSYKRQCSPQRVWREKSYYSPLPQPIRSYK
ncbi:hypothetical protein N665_1736s0001 [Sinapis alba]|nr:hypothetical protein N665_1736s0001 [Sinapis alba]